MKLKVLSFWRSKAPQPSAGDGSVLSRRRGASAPNRAEGIKTVTSLDLTHLDAIWRPARPEEHHHMAATLDSVFPKSRSTDGIEERLHEADVAFARATKARVFTWRTGEPDGSATRGTVEDLGGR